MADPEPQRVLFPIDFAIGAVVERESLVQSWQVRAAAEELARRRTGGEKIADLAEVLAEQALLSATDVTKVRQAARAQVAAQGAPAPASPPLPPPPALPTAAASPAAASPA
ncbi:MAG: hypothetical protein JKY65_04760, partial [Planctomycetes bacterium]|nr:hypothetical protein [Planctomycetota bacterium]